MDKRIIHTIELYQKIENYIVEWQIYYNHKKINKIIDFKINRKGYLIIGIEVITKDKKEEIHHIGTGVNIKRDMISKKDYNEYEKIKRIIELNGLSSIYEYINKYKGI